jgi:hypothetical protein
MQAGDWLTRGSAWVAFAAWFLALAMRPGHSHPEREFLAARIWLAGSLVMLLHTVLAFHFFHHWSHAAAVADTARQTEAVTGLNWGGGVWLNYLFAGVWLGDAVWRFASGAACKRQPRWLTWAIHGLLGFIWFNATVVFGSWPMRIAGAVVFLVLAVQYWRVRRSPRSSQLPDASGSA